MESKFAFFEIYSALHAAFGKDIWFSVIVILKGNDLRENVDFG